MATGKTIDRLTDTLKDSGLSWLLPNLRQDFVVWNALNDPDFLENVVQEKPNRDGFLPADFSPYKLALIALECSEKAGIERQEQMRSIDFSLATQVMHNQVGTVHSSAMRNFDSQSRSRESSSHLAEAGLTALSCLDQFNTTHFWKGLVNAIDDHPSQDWMAPIACLYGSADDPSGMLRALVQPGASPLRHELAIHALLSNPLTPTDQMDALIDLCHGMDGSPLPASDRILFLHALTEQRPQAALDFSLSWIALHPELPEPAAHRLGDSIQQIHQLEEEIFQVEIRRLAGNPSELGGLVEDEISVIENLHAGLINHYIVHNDWLREARHDRQGITRLYDHAIKLAGLRLSGNPDPASLSRLALSLAEQGFFAEASQLLPNIERSLPEDLSVLYAMAKVSLMAGDESASAWIAARIMELINQQPEYVKTPVWGEGYSLINLGKLLADLQMSGPASSVFERALRICPNDPGLLNLLAGSYKSSHQDQKAAETFNALVSLHPTDLDYRRLYAQSLEELGDWEASLDERWKIITAGSENTPSESIADRYEYAYCAIKANMPESALAVCTEILSQNPKDSQALIYSGEAHLLLNEIEKGMELLTQATQVAATLPEGWLALANAQKKILPLTTAIETLKKALDVVPDASQIHYRLGDYYLQANEPSLALPELQSAVELCPGSSKILVRYGEALNLLGHTDQARGIFSQAYRLEPEFPGLAQAYAKILLDMGEIEEAIPPLETLINSKTVREPDLYLDYARCILTLNKRGCTSHPPMKALIALNEVMQISPDHAEAKALIAEALAVNGENELAFQAYREALDTPLTEDPVWFERLSFGFGCLASALGKHDIAIAALQEAAQVNPNNTAILIALSDAYISANLAEDAVRSARDVLVIDGNNPENLAWFANQVARLGQAKGEIFNSAGDVFKEITSEALAALTKAIQLAPKRTDLLVQLGDFQSNIGESKEAQVTFSSIASLDFATIPDLLSAARYLSSIDDHASAIACLEKGISIDQRDGEKLDPVLYSALAQELVKNQAHASAIKILDQAIQVIPGNSSFISQKVDILLSMGQSLEALNVIEAAVHDDLNGKPDVDLLFLASRINRSMGNLSQSLPYARRAVASINEKVTSNSVALIPIQHRLHLAELYRALLQPDHAFLILQDPAELAQAAFANEQDYLDYIFLLTELALDTGGRIPAGIQDIKLEDAHPCFSRLMAINARLINKAGNYKQAELIYQMARDKINETELPAHTHGWSAPYYQYLNLVTAIDAAQDIGLWDEAMTRTQQVAELAPDEPLTQLNLAKILIRKSEFMHLCEIFDVTRHLPSSDGQPVEIYELCNQYLDRARSSLEAYRSEPVIDTLEIDNDEIYRWRTRADIIFSKDNRVGNESCESLAHQGSPEDIAAVIRHLCAGYHDDQDTDALTRIIKLARSYPRNLAVILQVALALQANDPQDALKSLQSVLEHNPYTKNPTMAFCHVLLARLGLALEAFDLAKGAIENAISFWPDEHGWHKLAAQVYRKSDEISQVIHHLQEIVNLAPDDLNGQLELGQALFEYAHDNSGLLTQALDSFQNALRLDPKNIPANFYLARVYFLMNDFDKAEIYAREAITLDPNWVDAYQLMSKIAIQKNDFQGAFDYAGRALQLDPKDAGSTVMLARSLSAMGRHDEALAKLNAVIPFVQEARPLYLEKVDIIRKVNGPQVALNELKSLRSTYPDDFSILSTLSKSFFEVGEVDNAVTVAQQALGAQTERAPTNERAGLHLLIGQVLRQSGQLDVAIQHLSEAIQLAPNQLEPYLELGLARKQQREYQQALQIFERATAIAPSDPRALFQAGLALKESKDYKSSETMLRRAVCLAPNDLAIRRQLAAVVALNLIHNPRSARINAQ